MCLLFCKAKTQTALKNPFRWKTFTTAKSPREVAGDILELLDTHSKVIFFTMRKYNGNMANNKFIIGQYVSGPAKYASTKLKGEVVAGDRTIVKLKLSLHFLIVGLITIFILSGGFGAYIMLTTHEMTINGVLREPLPVERIMFSMLFIALPPIVLYFNLIFPMQKLQRVLEEKLELEKIR
jgi:hypothetical protein